MLSGWTAEGGSDQDGMSHTCWNLRHLGQAISLTDWTRSLRGEGRKLRWEYFHHGHDPDRLCDKLYGGLIRRQVTGSGEGHVKQGRRVPIAKEWVQLKMIRFGMRYATTYTQKKSA